MQEEIRPCVALTHITSSVLYVFNSDIFRSFVRRVLLPSAHPPIGDGVVWKSAIEKVFLA